LTAQGRYDEALEEINAAKDHICRTEPPVGAQPIKLAGFDGESPGTGIEGQRFGYQIVRV
jgi:hypothetical protein